jgi:diguanylate cyclase (GGDEF)-like protein/PAS domain S-box-containing protein
MLNRLFRLAILACVLLAAAGRAVAGDPATGRGIRFGVLAFRPKPITEAQWRPVADYLSKSLHNRPVTLVALTYPELEEAVARRKVDFVLTQPASYVYLSTRYGLSSPLATLCNVENGMPVRTFGGVIAVKATRSDLQELGDLVGKRIATASAQSFGGYLMAAYELYKAGIALPKGHRLIETGMPHDRAIEQVLAGKADAAFVRSGLIEGMLKEGKITQGQLRTLNPRNPHDQPFPLSTRLYPEWPLAASPDVDEDLGNAFAAALLSMPHGGETAKLAHIHGFNVPMDYHPVTEVLMALRQPPFDKAPSFDLKDIWTKYRWQILVVATLMALVLLLTASLLRYNQRLRELKARAEEGDNRLHMFSAQLPGMIFEYHERLDGNAHYPYASDAALRLYQTTPAAMKADARNLREKIHPDDLEGYLERIRHSAETMTEWRGEYRVVFSDGSEHWRLSSATPQRLNDGSILWYGYAADIDTRKQLEDELVKQATTDALTDLQNRRSFFANAERELARLQRGKVDQGALIMIDLDHFKRINDTYGHGIGDEVLRHLAGTLMRTLRRSDLAGRLGGEEFAVLLPDTSEEQGVLLAERLRVSIAESSVTTPAGDIFFTASMGLTILDGTDQDIDTALDRADDALYRAKEAGRNRVHILRREP